MFKRSLLRQDYECRSGKKLSKVAIQQFDYLQYFSDSPEGNQTLVRSSLNHWKLQLFLASRIGSYAYSLVWIVCAKVKMSLIPIVHSEIYKQEKPIGPTHYPVTEPNVYSKVDSKGGNWQRTMMVLSGQTKRKMSTRKTSAHVDGHAWANPVFQVYRLRYWRH